MGGAAGKQSKIKKIYVKSKEDEPSDAAAAIPQEQQLSASSNAPPMNYAEQLAAAKAMGNPEASTSANSVLGADASHEQEQASSAFSLHRTSQDIYSSPELAMASQAFGAAPAARADAAMLPVMSPSVAQVSNLVAPSENARPIASRGDAAQSDDRSRQEREHAGHVEPQCLLALENRTSPRSFSSDEGSMGRTQPQVVPKMAFGQVPGNSRERRAQSFSSDEGSMVDSRPQALRETKLAFAQVLKESHDRRAQERADWVNSLAEATMGETAQAWAATDKQGLGFNDTRRPAPVLRDPDIFEQVRKWNVVHREEVPQAPPVRLIPPRCYAV